MLYIYHNIPKNIDYNVEGDIINYINLSQILNSVFNHEDIINIVNYIRWDENSQELQIDFNDSLSSNAKINLDNIINKV